MDLERARPLDGVPPEAEDQLLRGGHPGLEVLEGHTYPAEVDAHGLGDSVHLGLVRPDHAVVVHEVGHGEGEGPGDGGHGLADLPELVPDPREGAGPEVGEHVHVEGVRALLLGQRSIHVEPPDVHVLPHARVQGEDGECPVDVLDPHEVSGLELGGDLRVGVEGVRDGAHVASCVKAGLGVVAKGADGVRLEFFRHRAVGDYDPRDAGELVCVAVKLPELESLAFRYPLAECLGDQIGFLVG